MNDELRMKNEELLEQYLAGNAPLHADRLDLPSDEELEAAEAEFNDILAARRKPARHIHLWPWAVGIAAAVLVAVLFLWPEPENPSLALPVGGETLVPLEESAEEPLMAQQAEPEHPIAVKKKESRRSPKGVDNSLKKGIDFEEPIEGKIAGLTIVPTSADLGPGVKMRLGEDCPITAGVEPVPEEQQPDIVVPADKQALADIYLAEMALQVAYERQAQAEALRAYAASITGEEIPKAIIAY